MLILNLECVDKKWKDRANGHPVWEEKGRLFACQWQKKERNDIIKFILGSVES